MARLIQADLSGANLSQADLTLTQLGEADLKEAHLAQANLKFADLSKADLSGANLSGANLHGADLSGANLSGANLSSVDLRWAILVETRFLKATLVDCLIYGVADWNVHLEGATQINFVLTRSGHPTLTVDHLQVALFIAFVLTNQDIRRFITFTPQKIVLILGHFTAGREAVLEALKDTLRKQDYVPLVCNFGAADEQPLGEEISILAQLARCILFDLTDAQHIPREMVALVPTLQVAVQPLIQETEEEHTKLKNFGNSPWLLPTYSYKDLIDLSTSLKERVIEPLEEKIAVLKGD